MMKLRLGEVKCQIHTTGYGDMWAAKCPPMAVGHGRQLLTVSLLIGLLTDGSERQRDRETERCELVCLFTLISEVTSIASAIFCGSHGPAWHNVRGEDTSV